MSAGGFSIGPKGGYKNQKNFPLKNWRAECPKCSHIEIKEGDGFKCPNCNGDVQMTFAKLFGREWESEEARKSWRMISCAKGCGWSVNQITCSKCNATIQGDFFKGDEPTVTSNCFVATSAFSGANHPTISALQAWRDDVLLKKNAGRRFIRFYYEQGPKWAAQLDKAEFLKPIVRVCLTAFSKLVRRGRWK